MATVFLAHLSHQKLPVVVKFHHPLSPINSLPPAAPGPLPSLPSRLVISGSSPAGPVLIPQRSRLSPLHNTGWQKPRRDHFCHARGGTEPWELSGLQGVCVQEGGESGGDLVLQRGEWGPYPLLPTWFNSKDADRPATGLCSDSGNGEGSESDPRWRSGLD